MVGAAALASAAAGPELAQAASASAMRISPIGPVDFAVMKYLPARHWKGAALARRRCRVFFADEDSSQSRGVVCGPRSGRALTSPRASRQRGFVQALGR